MTLEILKRGEKGCLLWPIKYCRTTPGIEVATVGWDTQKSVRNTHIVHSWTWLWWVIKLTSPLVLNLEEIDKELDFIKRAPDTEYNFPPKHKPKT